MLRIHQLSLTPKEMEGASEKTWLRLCARKLSLPEKAFKSATLRKRSLDARGRGGVCWRVTVDTELRQVEKEKGLAAAYPVNQVMWMATPPKDHSVFSMELPPWKGTSRPIVVGLGPAGLFCAAALAARGARPIVLERGAPVEERAKDIALLESEGLLNPESNVLFGEGGAGTFSDGKLTCGINDPNIRVVLQTLAECGAPDNILIDQRPHIGTDELRKVLKQMRGLLIAHGAEIRFHTTMTDLLLKDGRICGVRTQHDGQTEELLTDTLCLCIGHSARDTYQRLNELGVPMVPKPFAIGVRVEHLQAKISRAQYGAGFSEALPPADYKLNVPTADQRGVYTFCMCPGGQVINASSEAGGINVNGMSLHARSGRNANAALLVGVRPEDFGSPEPLAGVALQRQIEQAAFQRTGSLKAPCQRVEDFLKSRETKAFGEVLPSYRPGVDCVPLNDILPRFAVENLRYALPKLGQRLRGFDHPDALLTGPEVRSSAPVRIVRNEQRESAIRGLFPLGEGAGYAGGIVSAAVDGLNAGAALGAKEQETPGKC